ncbi:hypothetical protein GBA52_011445 [Prunus armeniaca]|nr:hypothetical protein GBA52_011445 [Prunus armeniaca]
MANPGLSIQLIHCDSPESPLYQPNLTQSHRTQKLILLSKAHAMRLTKDLHSKYINNSNANVVRAKIDYQKDSIYMAQVSMGTFRSTPPISYFLDVDTGSGIIWIQCQECRNPGHHYIQSRTDLPQTVLLQYGTLNPYFVILQDISIAGSRLTIPANYVRRRSGRGGTIIDTETAYTFLVRPAYEMLERALVNYFSRMASVFRIHRQRFFNLCYQRTTTRGGFNNLPTITFHFSNADLAVQPQGAFYLGDTHMMLIERH